MELLRLLSQLEEQIAGTSAMGGPAKKTEFMPLTNISDSIKRHKKKKKKISHYISLKQSDVVLGDAERKNEGISVGRDKFANVRSKGNEEYTPGTKSKAKNKPNEISGRERKKTKRTKLNYSDFDFGTVGMFNKYV